MKSSFNENAADYDIWFDSNSDLYQAELQALRLFIPGNKNGIEIGVGTGRFAVPLGIPIGVEPAPQMAELARQRGIVVVEGIAEVLPFADSSFDFAVMVTVVCFLDDVLQAFREAFRILKPSGLLIVGFIDRESELGRKYNQKKAHSMFYRDATFYSVNELEALLVKAGFSAFSYRQTLLPEESSLLTVKDGYGSGGFVVVCAHKKEGAEHI
ncbi:class I SAM-dependent methyltransferase [Oryzomonas rubra]|uniref:Class I SAM-dependent methyltransferase n=1 Tax=Oryzomonas rubra TaxID=2509454 RepID=A0A5A9X6Z0_9BACT|nr:class I SAM-dependent methyltransferase [Oryzomonas rubra]KAA0888393.1 class I SAM-dependent methyltransferase [Oryzomonas rubra]